MDPTTPDEASPALRTPRDLGGTGILVQPVALDASAFGWASGIDATERVLDVFVGAGGNLVSTADQNAGGRSEIMIGSWLRAHDRGSIVLSTMVGKHPDASGLSARSILRAVESSLERLGTDYIDILGFDGDEPGRAIDDALEAADRLIREGKVRQLAAYGFTSSRVDEVALRSVEAGYPDFGGLFVDYSLMERKAYERDLQTIATRRGRMAVACLPLANGYLTGRFRTRDRVPDGVLYEGAFHHIGRHGSRVLDALDAVAKEAGTTPACVALAWVLVKPGIAAAVVRVRNEEDLDGYLRAADVRLTRQQLALLDRVSAS
ncbi:MAG TPA: aldo/keto reductase [Galbitalea sp.]